MFHSESGVLWRRPAGREPGSSRPHRKAQGEDPRTTVNGWYGGQREQEVTQAASTGGVGMRDAFIRSFCCCSWVLRRCAPCCRVR